MNTIRKPACVVDGEAYHDFGFTYFFDGSYWDTHIRARSHEEAEERLRALQYAKPLGRLVGRIPATSTTAPAVNTLVRLLCWLRRTSGAGDP